MIKNNIRSEIYNGTIYIFRKANIIFESIKTKIEDLKGIYLKINDSDFIGIDYSKIKSYSEERCILAHEIGHYETGTTYTYDIDELGRSRIEYRADKRAIHNLLPYNKFKLYIDEYRPNYICEIAEEFNITEKYAKKALELYKQE